MSEKNLLPSIRSGEIPEKQIDDKVRRILRMIVRMGYLDRPQKDSSIPLNNPESGRAALAIAEEGIVLLKNEKRTLPLDRARIKKIAVLGPDAHPGVPAGWGSSFVNPYYAVSVLDGLVNNKNSKTMVDYFGVGVGNSGPRILSTRIDSGIWSRDCAANIFRTSRSRALQSSTVWTNGSTSIG